MISENVESVIERMIRISKEKPLLPETFVPWDDEPHSETLFLPDKMVSLEGHPLWDTLTREQQIELGRLEVGLDYLRGMKKFKLRRSIRRHKMKQNEKVCPQGHKFFKSSSCPTCPVCEKEKNLTEHVFSSLSAPARRALEQKGISSLDVLARYSEIEILKLHGIGKSSIPKLKLLLHKQNLSFRA